MHYEYPNANRRLWSEALMIPCILLLTLVQVQNSSNNVRVVVNGESFMAPAHIRRNRVQVAMRPIFERLGA